jgi:iron(III) transport system substrate-binding protein
MHKILTPLLALTLLATACGSDTVVAPTDDAETTAASADNGLGELAATIHNGACVEDSGNAVTIYSGRSEDLVQPVLDAFECATGISTSVKYGDPTELAFALEQEGDRTPADIFLSKSPGAVGFLSNEGLLAPLSDEVLGLVDTQNSAADGEWVGVTGRKRVLVYNVDAVAEADLPTSVFELTEAEYSGRVALPVNNGSFLDWFTVFRATEGDDVATQWLADMANNDPIITESNRPTVDAVGRGEFDFGLVNHYYNFQEIEAIGEDHRALNHDFATDDIGSLLIITAAAKTASSANPESAEQLISYLLSAEAQTYFTQETLEYPLADGVAAADVLPALDQGINDFDVDFDSLGDGLQRTVEIIEASGING